MKKKTNKKKLLGLAASSIVLCGALHAGEIHQDETNQCAALGTGAELRQTLAGLNDAVDQEDYLAFWWLWEDDKGLGKRTANSSAEDLDSANEGMCGEGTCGSKKTQSPEGEGQSNQTGTNQTPAHTNQTPDGTDTTPSTEGSCGEDSCGSSKSDEAPSSNWWEQ